VRLLQQEQAVRVTARARLVLDRQPATRSQLSRASPAASGPR
jgi:hypothetical protein